MTKQLRIAVGIPSGGWYPAEGLVIEIDAEHWVIESVERDPDSVWHIDAIHRWTHPMSVLVSLRPATEDEARESDEQERQDTLELLAAVANR